MLCKYRHVFGEPGTGFHAVRLFNIAILDVVLTVVAAYYISKRMKWKLYWTLLGAFAVGIVLHRIFCVNTTFNTLIFGKVGPYVNESFYNAGGVCMVRPKNTRGDRGNGGRRDDDNADDSSWDGTSLPTRDLCYKLSKEVPRTKEGVLKIHNCYRRMHDLPDLAWNDAAAAAANASPLICRQDICNYTASCHDDNNRWSQNIGWMGPVSVKQFYDEIDLCPDKSRPQDCKWSMNTGHLVTMMKARSVGCAVKQKGEKCDELRCNYA